MLKDMDLKELDRRIKKGVRNILISPLFEKDKTYNLNTELEDENGTLRPDWTHCWLTWQSKWTDEEKTEHWSEEAYSFGSLETARLAQNYLEKHLA